MTLHHVHRAAALALLVGLIGACSAEADTATPPNPATIVAAKARPQADRALDADRHPPDLLALLDHKAGQTVADVWPGDYWDRLFANAVGPTGKVFAVHLEEADKAEDIPTPPAGSTPLAGHPNVIAVVTSANSLALPEPADVIWMRQNYHDLYDAFMGPADVPAFNKAVYAALKPGGRFVVIDHAAPDGSGLADTETTHRIDGERVKADLAAAGFRLVAESEVLRNPADDRTKLVFDPSVKGKTDQFVYVFERP
jgi:predicted methyltransferase